VDLSGQYDFSPRACKPYLAHNKGKYEQTPALHRTQCGASVAGYIKGNFFQCYRFFVSWEHINQLAEQWVRGEADQSLHGTVREVVAERFEREKPSLKPLPRMRHHTPYYAFRQVAWDGYIDVSGNRYSVPGELVGQRVAVRTGLDGTLRVFQAKTLVASHLLSEKKAG
jgi:hypothetical protein